MTSRGTQADHRARPGRQAPQSGWQGAIRGYVTCDAKLRPSDPIAVARKLAEETV